MLSLPSPSFWLIIWTANNIAVTLLNKAAFGTFVDFPYPYALTAVHMFVCALASNLFSNGKDGSSSAPTSRLPDSPTTKQSSYSTMTYSLLFTLNICLGNVSLRHVSINLNQVVRSLVPVFTLWLTDYCYCFTATTKASPQRRRAVWPVVVGVALACAGVVEDTTLGVVITVACAFAAALKVVASAQLLAQSFSPMELLRSMAPSACVQCLFLSVVTRERIWEHSMADAVWWLDTKTVIVVLLSGVAAFGLNITAFEAYRATSPVTCCIAASVKQVLLVAVATALFHTPVTAINCFGMILVLVSSAYYSYLSIIEKETGNSADKDTDGDHQLQKLVTESRTDDEEQQQGLIVSPSSREGAVQRRA